MNFLLANFKLEKGRFWRIDERGALAPGFLLGGGQARGLVVGEEGVGVVEGVEAVGEVEVLGVDALALLDEKKVWGGEVGLEGGSVFQ